MRLFHPKAPGIIVLFLVLALFQPLLPLFSQEGEVDVAEEVAEDAAEDVAEDAAEDQTPTDSQKVIEMDIHTSSLLELADWCRRLGLSDSGTKEALAALLRSHYGLPPQSEEESKEKSTKSTIIIESARNTEYFTLEAVNEEYVRLLGDVEVSFKDGETVHHLHARELLYNRTRNTLSASGDVEYRKEGGDTLETFKGQSLFIEMDDWTGVFMDGASERSKEDDEDTIYRFSGDVISLDGEEVTVIQDATISNAKSKEAYWSIDASKLWLLPGSEWAIFNALLKVGEIPVLYIPFFYLPGDELVFHPVLGYRSREGNYIQTTTYLLGRPKAVDKEEKSIMSILGSGKGMERERHGIFLRSLGRRVRDKEETNLSLLFDVYANLGTYLGMDLSLPKLGYVGKTDLSLGLGWSRNIYQISPDYFTPFDQFEGTSEWNKGRIFSNTFPFRIRLKSTTSLTFTLFSLSASFPLYSDPFVDKDFLDRSEDMDWFNLIKQGSAFKDEEANIGTVSSYNWNIQGSTNLSFPILAPFINTLKFTNLSSALKFASRSSTEITNSVSPERMFFFPENWNLYSISGSIAGKLISIGEDKSDPSQVRDEKTTEATLSGDPRSPWEEETEDTKTAKPKPPTDPLIPPPLKQEFSSISEAVPFKTSLEYSITPSVNSDLKYRSSKENWPEAKDIEWDEQSSILTNLRADSSVTHKISLWESLLSSTLVFSGNFAWQEYSYMNLESEEFDTEAEQNIAILKAYNATNFNSSSDFVLKLSPFGFSPTWKDTNLQYRLKGLLMKSAFSGTVEEPEWEDTYGEWNKDDLTFHQLSLNLAASIREKTQTLSLTADLPPEDSVISGNTAIRIWNTTTTMATSILDLFNEPLYKPITFTETLDFGVNRNFKQTVVYDPELEEFTSLTSNLSWFFLTASYVAAYSKSYALDENFGWKVTDEPERLRPKSLSLGFKANEKVDDLWRRRLGFTLNLNTSLSFDLQQYTYSYLDFSLDTTWRISEFLDLSLTAKSRNEVLFRYFQDLPFWDEQIKLPGEQNPFVDLLNSFRFDSDELRKESGYKLKSFVLGLTHHMGDWNAKLDIKLNPYLDKETHPYRYRFNNEISFLVQWIPIKEIKTETFKDKDGFVFK